jgi:hypothetical protein
MKKAYRKTKRHLALPAGIVVSAVAVGYLAGEAMTFGTGITLFATASILLCASVRSDT